MPAPQRLSLNQAIVRAWVWFARHRSCTLPDVTCKHTSLGRCGSQIHDDFPTLETRTHPHFKFVARGGLTPPISQANSYYHLSVHVLRSYLCSYTTLFVPGMHSIMLALYTLGTLGTPRNPGSFIPPKLDTHTIASCTCSVSP